MKQTKDLSVDPKLFRVENLSGYAKRDPISFIQILDPNQITTDKKILLFIHGAGYTDEHETVRDLVKPFLRHAGIPLSKLNENYHLYFLSWNSDIICKTRHSIRDTWHRRLTAIADSLRGSSTWGPYLADVEARAQIAAKYLEPFFIHMVRESNGKSPEVVTHSLGSFLLADMIQRLSTEGRVPKNLGTWLSLQPAVEESAFGENGRFHRVPQAYNHPLARKEIWFSRVDLVLKFLYQKAKRARPLGLTGKNIPQHWILRDLTWKIREAHGGISFFSRVSYSLKLRYLHVS